MGAIFAYFGNLFREGTKESFGRVISMPFLFSAWGILTAGGILEIVQHKSAPIDTALTLAGIGVGLYTGSKYLWIKGKNTTIGVGDEKAAVATGAEKEDK